MSIFTHSHKYVLSSGNIMYNVGEYRLYEQVEDKVKFLKSYYKELIALENPTKKFRKGLVSEDEIVFNEALKMLFTSISSLVSHNVFYIGSILNCVPFAICGGDKSTHLNQMAKYFWLTLNDFTNHYLAQINIKGKTCIIPARIIQKESYIKQIQRFDKSLSDSQILGIAVMYLADLIENSGPDTSCYFLYTNDASCKKNDAQVFDNYHHLKRLFFGDAVVPPHRHINLPGKHSNVKSPDHHYYYSVKFAKPSFSFKEIFGDKKYNILADPPSKNYRTYPPSEHFDKVYVFPHAQYSMQTLLNGIPCKEHIDQWCAKYQLEQKLNFSIIKNLWWHNEGRHLENSYGMLKNKLSCHDIFVMWCKVNSHPLVACGHKKYQSLYKKWWKQFKRKTLNEI